MSRPDFERARQYALAQLQNQLPTALVYHSMAHTVDDVVPAAAFLAACEGVAGLERIVLLTAAYYHDLGFIERYGENETLSARLAAAVLPRFGYSPAQVATIGDIILATRLPQEPHTLLEEIMADADLDVLGRDDFEARNRLLRLEMAAYGAHYSDEDWCREQVMFLQSHHYFTPAARDRRSAGQQRNIVRLAASMCSAAHDGERNDHGSGY